MARQGLQNFRRRAYSSKKELEKTCINTDPLVPK
jgi:hypothetical protein